MDYTELKNKIKGPIFSIITPFKNNGKDIDYDGLVDYIKFMYTEGAKIFYAMAFNTRYLIMSEEEIFKVNEIVIKTVKDFNDPETVIIVGDPLDCSTDTSIKFAQHAKEHGADMISLIYRAYLFFDDHVYDHYKTVADAVDIGILVHEMPFNKGIPQHQDGTWSLNLIDRLADIPSIVAMKEDAKQDEYTRTVVETISDRVAIVVSGNGLQQWSKVSDKCQSWLTGIGNFCPKMELDFYKYHLEGNQAKCNEIIEKIEKPYFWIKDNLSWHLGIKSTLEILGIMSREERMPYQSLNEEQHRKVEEIMREISKNTDYFNL
jgi:4-hydroxy-tetrahydrodipicolinate synthase